ncbi:MAG: FkbM family methyltransferase [Halioglobus sp.]
MRLAVDVMMLRRVLRRHEVDFYFKDRFGIMSRRELSDGLGYILTTKNSCDAAPLIEALEKRGDKFDVSFDIGSNIGLVTAFLSRVSRVCYAFEPEPNNYARCEEQIELNHCANVVMVDLALTDAEGQGELFVMESYGHHSLGPVKTSGSKGVIPIRMTTVDHFCELNKIDQIDFMKVDVEGFEREVFLGASGMLLDKKVSLIAFEVSQAPLESLGKKASDIFSLLRSLDYEIIKLNGESFAASPSTIWHEDFFARPLRS